MAIRTALRQSAVLTFAAIAAFLWLLWSGLQVYESLDLYGPASVGQTTFSGVVGLAVVITALVLVVVLSGELSATDPGPEPWPPSE